MMNQMSIDVPYEESLIKYFKKLEDLNKNIIAINNYVEQKSLELKITELLNKKTTIESYKKCLFELNFLEKISFNDVWIRYSHIFIKDEVLDAPDDLDYDNNKLFSYIKEQAL